MTQSGNHVQMSDNGLIGEILDGASVTIGFVAYYTGVNNEPTTFFVNGMLAVTAP